jgi:hypothetical protein
LLRRSSGNIVARVGLNLPRHRVYSAWVYSAGYMSARSIEREISTCTGSVGGDAIVKTLLRILLADVKPIGNVLDDLVLNGGITAARFVGDMLAGCACALSTASWVARFGRIVRLNPRAWTSTSTNRTAPRRPAVSRFIKPRPFGARPWTPTSTATADAARSGTVIPIHPLVAIHIHNWDLLLLGKLVGGLKTGPNFLRQSSLGSPSIRSTVQGLGGSSNKYVLIP